MTVKSFIGSALAGVGPGTSPSVAQPDSRMAANAVINPQRYMTRVYWRSGFSRDRS
jgi:hypothetical protein